jgi:hypothetical protein
LELHLHASQCSAMGRPVAVAPFSVRFHHSNGGSGSVWARRLVGVCGRGATLFVTCNDGAAMSMCDWRSVAVGVRRELSAKKAGARRSTHNSADKNTQPS